MRALVVLLFALVCGPAFGAIATIPVEGGGSTATGVTTGGIATANFNVSAGDIVITVLRIGGTSDTSTAAVLSAACSSETLTKAGASNNGVNTMVVFYKINSGGGTACGGSVTFSGSTTYRVNTYLVRGALTASPFDPSPLTNAVAGTFTSGTSATTSTFTQGSTDELVLCIVSTDGSPATIAPGGSETEAFAEYNNRLQVEYLSSATAGSKTCSWSFATATAGNYWMFGVKSSTSSSVTTPSLSSVSKTANSTQGNTYTYTPSLGGAASVTVTLGAYQAGVGCPSAANVVAGTGTGFVAKVTKSSTTTDTITSTGLDFPEHDYCLVATNAAGNSSVSSDTNVFKDPPTGYSYQVLTSVDGDSWYGTSISSPSAAAGDVGEISDPTVLLAQDVELFDDGHFSFSNSGARDLLCVRTYDYSVGGWMTVSPTSSTCNNSPTNRAAIWFNNQPPLCPAPDAVALFLSVGAPITPIDLSVYHSDAEGDALTTTGQNLHGLVIASDIMSGTISAGVYTDPVITVTDIAGDTCSW